MKFAATQHLLSLSARWVRGVEQSVFTLGSFYVQFQPPPLTAKHNIIHSSMPDFFPRRVLREKMGGTMRPASQSPYPIYDQIMRFSLPYLGRDQKFETLSFYFMT